MIYNKIEKQFLELGIDISSPGFYNDANFLEVEKRNPNILEMYAFYVAYKSFDIEYIKRAEFIIREASTFLVSELKKDIRLGVCVGMSSYLVKILEKFNIWSFCLSGMTKVEIKNSNLPTVYFQPFNINGITGHQWVFAPPFGVVDLTLKYQNYEDQYGKYIDEFLAIKRLEPQKYNFNDFVESEYRHMIPGPQTYDNLKTLFPQPFGFGELISNGRFESRDCKVTYFPLAVKMSEELSLEDMDDCDYKPSGKTPIQLYNEFLEYLNER